ncbi:PepSY-associated TM helix domain-containing protein [Longimicrobium sp.]|uniref:PepSY-associated TM helix domain-containing protein n=1 Tax=Longimicrobium sp. TaxID=2029185 RepID=UPI002F920805
MRQFRNVIFWAHLLTAIPAALVVLVMSVTGVLLTYQRELTAWADIRGLNGSPPAAGAARLPADVLMQRVTAAEKGKPTTLRWHAGPERPVEVAFGREKTVFVNAYTGQVLSAGSRGVRGFFRTVVAWHRWLGAQGEGPARDRGKAVTGAANLMFLFLVVSGFYLWWPRNWNATALRNVLVFRRGLPGKARDFNWHNVIGFWSAVPLFLIVLSGVVISYRWAGDLVYRAVGEAPPPPTGGGASAGARGGKGDAPTLTGMEALRVRVERQVDGWRSITLQIPSEADKPVAFTIDRGDGGQPQKRASLSLSATGEVEKWEPFAASTRGRQVRSFLRFAHTGEVAGLAGQTVAGLVSLGAALLVWTGLSLSLRRFRAWRGRRRERPVPGPDSPGDSARPRGRTPRALIQVQEPETSA